MEFTVNEMARRRGVAPEELVVSALRDQLSAMAKAIEPKDEWKRLTASSIRQKAQASPIERRFRRS
jgi:hypothetical protein